MILIVPLSSNIVSGASTLLVHLVFLSILTKLLTSLAKSFNIRRIYDQRLPLCPMEYNMGVTNAPVSYKPFSIVFAVLSLLYLIAAVCIEFSINGSTRNINSSTLYRSVVKGSIKGIPIDIDYDNEFSVNETGHKLVSRRLVALRAIGGCKYLNFSHHVMFAYAFKDVHLDKSLVSVSHVEPDAKCITSRTFEKEMKMFEFEEIPFSVYKCSLKDVMLNVTYEGNRKIGTAKIPEGSCDLKIHTVKCSKHDEEQERCIAIASNPNMSSSTQPSPAIIITIWNAKYPENPAMFEFRNYDATKAPPDHLDTFATNVAYFTSIGFTAGVFDSMYMAFGEIEYNRTLVTVFPQNVTEILLNLALPAFIFQIFGFSLLICLQIWYRRKYVGQARKNKISFVSVDDVFAMIQEQGGEQGLQNRRDPKIPTPKRYIKLRDGRPQILINELEI